jgi:hypothetical protein
MKSPQNFERRTLRALILGLALMGAAISALFPTSIPSLFHLTDVAAQIEAPQPEVPQPEVPQPEVPQPEAPQICAPGQEDMLDWLTLDPQYRQSYHLWGAHDLYTYVNGSKIYWIKHHNGGVWDAIKITNGKIYWWATELEGDDPDAVSWQNADGGRYRQFLANNGLGLLATNRCVKPGSSASKQVTYDTIWQRVIDCDQRDTHNLGTSIKFQVSDRSTVNVGGFLGNLEVIKLTYKYFCDVSFSGCQKYEVYWLNKRYGLVRWEKYEAPFSGGTPVRTASSTFNYLVSGAGVVPKTPCFFSGLIAKPLCTFNAEE